MVKHVALASQKRLGLIPGLGVMCGLSLLLVLVLVRRGFSLGTPVFPSPQKTCTRSSCHGLMPYAILSIFFFFFFQFARLNC